jgi:membrane-associated HD superfamily phosphohydrolase
MNDELLNMIGLPLIYIWFSFSLIGGLFYLKKIRRFVQTMHSSPVVLGSFIAPVLFFHALFLFFKLKRKNLDVPASLITVIFISGFASSVFVIYLYLIEK